MVTLAAYGLATPRPAEGDEGGVGGTTSPPRGAALANRRAGDYHPAFRHKNFEFPPQFRGPTPNPDDFGEYSPNNSSQPPPGQDLNSYSYGHLILTYTVCMGTVIS